MLASRPSASSQPCFWRAIPSMQTETLSRLRQQAQLQIVKRDTGEDRYELLEPLPAKASRACRSLIPVISFSTWKATHSSKTASTYLFGFVYTDHGERMFKPFWAHSRTEEKHAPSRRLWISSCEQLTEYPDAYVYHYASYEETAFKRLSVLHGTKKMRSTTCCGSANWLIYTESSARVFACRSPILAQEPRNLLHERAQRGGERR